MFLNNIIDSINKNKNVFYCNKKINQITVEKTLNFDFSNFYYNKNYYSNFLEELNNYLKFIELFSGSPVKIGSAGFVLSNFKRKKFFNLSLKLKAPVNKNPEDFFLIIKAAFIQMRVILKFLNLKFFVSAGKKNISSVGVFLKNFHFFFSLLNSCWINLFSSSIHLNLFFSDKNFSDFFFKKISKLILDELVLNEEI